MALQNSRLMHSLGSFWKWLIGGRWASGGGDLRGRQSIVAIWVNETDLLTSDDPPTAKPKNFRPRPNKANDGRLELSSFCLEGLVFQDRKWKVLQQHSRLRPVLGRSEIDISVLKALNLIVDADWNPPRHVNIYDWPKAEDEKLAIMQELHAKQRFTKRW